MNKHFDFKRFYQFLKMELSEKIGFILKLAAILCLIIIVFWLLGKFFDILAGKSQEVISISSRGNYLVFCYVLTALVAPFGMYKNINHPKKGVSYASLPVSINEKFLSMLIITIVVTPLVVVASFFCVDFIMVFIDICDSLIVSDYFLTSPLSNIFMTVIGFQAMFIFGNSFFIKNKAVKTILSIALLYVVISVIVTIFLHKLGANNMNNWYWISNNQMLILNIVKWITLVFHLCFLVATYYRMKTQQYK